MSGETESQKLKSTIDESDLVYHEQVGRGGSGDVYRVTWKSKKIGFIQAAAKKIPLLKDETAEEKFGSEVNYLQTLKHENIIAFYGQVITRKYIVIVTEYAANGSLYDYLKKRTTPLPLQQKLEWAIQAVKAIGYLRDNHILHRDIKSGNFLLTSDNILKICDFGIAKDLTSTKTTTSEKGTVRWLAPEVFTEQNLSPKADIFAFGIMLWELETGQVPYKGIISARVPWVVGNGQRPEIPAICHPVLKDLMQQCWKEDRHIRPDVEKILEQLKSCLESIAVHVMKRSHNLSGNPLLLAEKRKDTRLLEVSGFKSNTIKDMLEMYFENTRRSGGGDISDIEIDMKMKNAVITFVDQSVIDRVLKKSHTLGGINLTVFEKCARPIDKHMILLRGIPNGVSEEMLMLFIESVTKINQDLTIVFGKQPGTAMLDYVEEIQDLDSVLKRISERQLLKSTVTAKRVMVTKSTQECWRFRE